MIISLQFDLLWIVYEITMTIQIDILLFIQYLISNLIFNVGCADSSLQIIKITVYMEDSPIYIYTLLSSKYNVGWLSVIPFLILKEN